MTADSPGTDDAGEQESAPLTSSNAHTRRQLLKGGAGLGILGALGYGLLLYNRERANGADSTLTDTPNSAVLVFHGDAQALFDQVPSLAERFEAETGFDPREVDDIRGFGTTGSSGDAAVTVMAPLDPNTVEQRLEETDRLRATGTYRGRDRWVVGSDELPRELHICALDDEQFVIGTERAVIERVDVHTGDIDPATGDVVTAFDRAGTTLGADGESLLRAGFVLPPELAVSFDLPGLAEQLFENIEFGYAAVGADETVHAALEMEGSESAESLRQTLETVRMLDAETLSNALGIEQAVAERLATALETVGLEASGSTVEIEFPNAFEWTAILVETFL